MEDPREQYLAAEHQIRQIQAQQLDNHVYVMLLDMQIAMREAYPNTVDVKPLARKIVAFLREHMVRE